MKLIDIDRIKSIDNHIHYINVYEASAVCMGTRSEIHRLDIKFSIEYRPLGEPIIKVNFLEHPNYPVLNLIKKLKEKILHMDSDGSLSKIHTKK